METLFLLWLYLSNPGHSHSPLLSFLAPWLSGTPQQSSVPQDSSRGVNKANQAKGLDQRGKSCMQKEDKGCASSLWPMLWVLNPRLQRVNSSIFMLFFSNKKMYFSRPLTILLISSWKEWSRRTYTKIPFSVVSNAFKGASKPPICRTSSILTFRCLSM